MKRLREKVDNKIEIQRSKIQANAIEYKNITPLKSGIREISNPKPDISEKKRI